MKNHGHLWTAVRIILLVLVWGASFSVYKVALADTPPILFAGIRTFLGGLVVAMIAWPKRREIRWRQTWHIYLISSLFNVVLFFGLQTAGLFLLPAGLMSVLIYLEPVLVGLFAYLWLGEGMSASKIVGLCLGFAGVAAISVDSFRAHLSVLGVVIGIATAVAWAIGTIYTKKVQGRAPMLWLLAIQFIVGGLVLTGVGSVSESWSSIVWAWPLWMGFAFAAFIGCSLSWIIWFSLVHEGEASRVAAFTFMVPLLSVLIAAVFLHEALHTGLILGLVGIVLGIWLVNRKSRKPLRTRRSKAKDAHPVDNSAHARESL